MIKSFARKEKMKLSYLGRSFEAQEKSTFEQEKDFFAVEVELKRKKCDQEVSKTVLHEWERDITTFLENYRGQGFESSSP